MAGVMKIYEITATASGTDKTASTVRLKLADNQTVDNNDPITIPSDGVDYRRSFTKQLRMYCATAPSVQIDNLRAYTDGANGFGTGVSVNASAPGITWAANATSAISTNDLFGYTSGAPFDLDAVRSAAVTSQGYCGDILKIQMVVASTASPGKLTSETITFAYNSFAPIWSDLYSKPCEFRETLTR